VKFHDISLTFVALLSMLKLLSLLLVHYKRHVSVYATKMFTTVY